MEAALNQRKAKYLNEKSIDKWDNQQLVNIFKEDEIKRVVMADKASCSALILPRE